MKSLFNEFEVVTSESDRALAFSELGRSHTPIITATAEGVTFSYTLSKFEKMFLVLAPIKNSPLSAESVYLIFSVSTGQYMMRGPLKAAREGVAVFNANTELRRLQRRKNFRVNTQNISSVKLEIEKMKHELTITDVSGGGLSAIVPSSITGSLGQPVKCTIKHPTRTVSDLQGVVRHIDKIIDGEKWGIEFDHLSTDQMQQLLALSLQLHREKII